MLLVSACTGDETELVDRPGGKSDDFADEATFVIENLRRSRQPFYLSVDSESALPDGLISAREVRQAFGDSCAHRYKHNGITRHTTFDRAEHHMLRDLVYPTTFEGEQIEMTTEDPFGTAPEVSETNSDQVQLALKVRRLGGDRLLLTHGEASYRLALQEIEPAPGISRYSHQYNEYDTISRVRTRRDVHVDVDDSDSVVSALIETSTERITKPTLNPDEVDEDVVQVVTHSFQGQATTQAESAPPSSRLSPGELVLRQGPWVPPKIASLLWNGFPGATVT